MSAKKRKIVEQRMMAMQYLCYIYGIADPWTGPRPPGRKEGSAVLVSADLDWNCVQLSFGRLRLIVVGTVGACDRCMLLDSLTCFLFLLLPRPFAFSPTFF